MLAQQRASGLATGRNAVARSPFMGRMHALHALAAPMAPVRSPTDGPGCLLSG